MNFCVFMTILPQSSFEISKITRNNANRVTNIRNQGVDFVGCGEAGFCDVFGLFILILRLPSYIYLTTCPNKLNSN